MGIPMEKFFELDDWLKEHSEMSWEERIEKLEEMYRKELEDD